MTEIGKLNTLRVVKELDFGIYLDGEQLGEILMPRRYVPAGTKPGDKLEVFIYLDSEDRFIATTERPFASVGDFALLDVVGVNSVGAFLDWGLPKDLLVPFREQKQKLEVGKSYVVFVYLDVETNRIVASAKPEKFLDRSPADFEEGEGVDLLILSKTDLGYKAMINKTHTGVLYKNEVFESLEKGQQLKGYIRKIRPDGKVDLILHKPGYEKVDDISKQILDKLKEKSGFIALNDKSSAESIYEMFRVSKKTYKKAIGALYRERVITIEDAGIRLN
ncbi:MAG: GntR family transcriptional regulator [Bacteroidetes bacterium]|nr:GntR family transcriptional regulator [Bacteroidota bacterium]